MITEDCRYTGKEGRIYDRGFHDGSVETQKNLAAKYDKELNDMVGDDAYYELSRTFEMERKIEVFEAWQKISHYISAISHLIEAEPEISERTKMLAVDIRGEVDNAYLIASDEYEEIRAIQEACAEECCKNAGGRGCE